MPNLVCEFLLDDGVSHTIFGLTLTFDPVCRIIVSRTYLLYYLKWESHIWCVDTSWDGGVSCTITGNCDLKLDL